MKNYLICIDMQNDFVTGALPNEGAKKAIPYIKEHISDFDGVFFTRDTHYSNYSETLEGKYLPVPHCIENTNGWEIVDELKQFAKITNVVNKNTFGYMMWRDFFKVVGITIKEDDVITIMGTVNPICPLANAIILRATYPNNEIVMDFKGCGFMDESDKDVVKRVLDMQQIKYVE